MWGDDDEVVGLLDKGSLLNMVMRFGVSDLRVVLWVLIVVSLIIVVVFVFVELGKWVLCFKDELEFSCELGEWRLFKVKFVFDDNESCVCELI